MTWRGASVIGSLTERFPPARTVVVIRPGTRCYLDSFLCLVPCEVLAVWRFRAGDYGVQVRVQVEAGPYDAGEVLNRTGDALLPWCCNDLGVPVERARDVLEVRYEPGGTPLPPA